MECHLSSVRAIRTSLELCRPPASWRTQCASQVMGELMATWPAAAPLGTANLSSASLSGPTPGRARCIWTRPAPLVAAIVAAGSVLQPARAVQHCRSAAARCTGSALEGAERVLRSGPAVQRLVMPPLPGAVRQLLGSCVLGQSPPGVRQGSGEAHSCAHGSSAVQVVPAWPLVGRQGQEPHQAPHVDRSAGNSRMAVLNPVDALRGGAGQQHAYSPALPQPGCNTVPSGSGQSRTRSWCRYWRWRLPAHDVPMYSAMVLLGAGHASGLCCAGVRLPGQQSAELWGPQPGRAAVDGDGLRAEGQALGPIRLDVCTCEQTPTAIKVYVPLRGVQTEMLRSAFTMSSVEVRPQGRDWRAAHACKRSGAGHRAGHRAQPGRPGLHLQPAANSTVCPLRCEGRSARRGAGCPDTQRCGRPINPHASFSVGSKTRKSEWVRRVPLLAR